MNRLLNIFGKVAFVLCLISITMLSLSPSDIVPQVGSYDKMVHFLSYLGLSFSFWFGFQNVKSAWKVSLMLVLLVLFGLLIEGLQSFVPGRLMSLMDGVANGLGVLVGYAVFKCLLKFKIGVLK